MYFGHIFPPQPLSSLPLGLKTVSLLTSCHLITILGNDIVDVPLSPTRTDDV